MLSEQSFVFNIYRRFALLKFISFEMKSGHMLTVFGTIALDTTRTPFKSESNILGGAATFAAIASSMFTETSIVGIIGSDFPAEYRNILDKRVDTRGIITDNSGKTFHYDSSFDYDLSHRTTNKTELNVVKEFAPVIPTE